jgi:histidinol-phosphate aminotransferase
VPAADIAAFAERVPRHACLIVDEAYCEYNTLDDPDTTLDLLKRHPNVVLLRTFSKVYGLCGLRVGYALCGSDELVTAVNQVRQPFFCNAVAQAAAIEALRHGDAVSERVERTVSERLELEDGLRALGIEPAESQANFAWFDLPARDGAEPTDVERRVVGELARRGVLVRAGAALGRPGALRVTYGTAQQNARFLRELGELLA